MILDQPKQSLFRYVVIGAALGAIYATVPMYLGYAIGKAAGENPTPTIDCAPPQSEYDKTIARLERDASGNLVLVCHYETIQAFGRGSTQ